MIIIVTIELNVLLVCSLSFIRHLSENVINAAFCCTEDQSPGCQFCANSNCLKSRRGMNVSGFPEREQLAEYKRMERKS